MSKVECFGDVSSTVKSQSFMFRSSARAHTRTYTCTRTIRRISTPPPLLLLHLGNSKGGWHDQPVHAAPSHAQTRRRARTHATHTCTQMAPRDKERTGTWATYQMSRQIFARWCIWASHPPIRPPSNHQPAREVLIDLLHTIYSLHPGSNRFRLSSCPPPPPLSGFGWLFWERTFTQTRTREPSPAPPCTKVLPHLPTEDRCIQMSHRAPANVPLVRCVAAQRGGGEASRSCLFRHGGV